MDFIVPSTIDTAKALLGVKVIYQDTTQTYTGYILIPTWWHDLWTHHAHPFIN